MKRLVFLLIIISGFHASFLTAQSTSDRIKYYVLFDVSGSASSLDIQGKRFNLLEEFLQNYRNIDKQFSKDEIYFQLFGDTLSTFDSATLSQSISKYDSQEMSDSLLWSKSDPMVVVKKSEEENRMEENNKLK